jgi:hypothetical protein
VEAGVGGEHQDRRSEEGSPFLLVLERKQVDNSVKLIRSRDENTGNSFDLPGNTFVFVSEKEV